MALKILLLEDNKQDANLIQIELNRGDAKYHITVTDNENEFLNILKNDPPDIILSDYNLPRFNAIDALNIMGQLTKDIPFIMVTGNLSDQQAVECMDHGAWDYILKDRISRLRPAIENALNRLHERKNKDIAREELKVSEQKFETIFDRAPIGIIIVNSVAEISLINKEFEKKFNLRNSTLNGRKLTSLMEKEFIPQFETLLNSKTTSWNLEVKFIHPLQNYPLWTVLYATKVLDQAINEFYYIIHIEDVTESKIGQEKLNEAYQQLKKLKNNLKEENIYLREEIKLNYNFDDIITRDNKMIALLKQIEKIAITDSTTLITGETGTGKELFARAIHENSHRSDKPFVKINCAAIPENLIESELFGYEKGAFTGAVKSKKGKFELADKGTIFLDEIGELPVHIQPKLLRVLQEGEIEKIGAGVVIKTDVRVIAATNRNLSEEVKKQSFREDLYYRLNIIPLEIPPLRERVSDIQLLVNFFLKKFNKKFGKSIDNISPGTLIKLQKYNWPGNIRELENVIERAVILTNSKELNLRDWEPANNEISINQSEILPIDEVEKKYILEVLERFNWRVSGNKGAAKVLGLKPTTLESRMKKLGISRG